MRQAQHQNTSTVDGTACSHLPTYLRLLFILSRRSRVDLNIFQHLAQFWPKIEPRYKDTLTIPIRNTEKAKVKTCWIGQGGLKCWGWREFISLHGLLERPGFQRSPFISTLLPFHIQTASCLTMAVGCEALPKAKLKTVQRNQGRH